MRQRPLGVQMARTVALMPRCSGCLRNVQNLGTDWDERVLPSIGNEVRLGLWVQRVEQHVC